MIKDKYVLFTRIPLIRNSEGRFFCDDLWAKDLILHLDYISRLMLCCPIIDSENISNLVCISDYRIEKIFPLKQDYGIVSVIQNLVPNFIGVIKACKEADICHSGGAGWAFPLSFYLLLLRPLLKFQWIIVIESSFWMLSENQKKTARNIIEHYSYTWILRLCLWWADARIFTQSFYKKYFIGNSNERTLVAPAIWVNESDILSLNDFNEKWLNTARKVPELIFPSRLIEDKGVFVLFQAIEHLKKQNCSVNITIMGDGALKEKCQIFCQQDFGSVKVQYRNPVNYGQDFFSVLREYDAVLVCNLKEEQPRIIFDAFSQGLPVIASDTSGILDIVNKKNSLIFQDGDSLSLAQKIQEIVEQLKILEQMGQEALKYIDGKNHHQMHIDRFNFLNSTLKIS
ncbi:glycosyltransferase [Geminocystis sp. GBBB08]|uniref:glycosyltransferase n=1 Tax=Geminocystis sp. GBBB08 TaxID=2604140 RepID=UPI0027E25EB7|nr:glycosyltransferase [Geminocystis sp. GBBB08]MBL1210698.1 glycosyltransferase family 4 protein [Geminocystis sp. GBBB08]